MNSSVFLVLLALLPPAGPAEGAWAPGTSLSSKLSVADPDPQATPGLPPVVDALLRVDPGDHVGPVRVMSASEDGRFLVTGSTDQTVRVWRAEDLSPVRTWRPRAPVGGLLISKDGRSVAASSTAGGGYDLLLAAAGEVELPETLRRRILWKLSNDGENAWTLDHHCKVSQVPLNGGPERPVLDRSSERSYDWLSALAAPDEAALAVACSTAPPGAQSDLHLLMPGWKTTIALDAPASAIAFSPDRRQLAVGLWGSDAIRLYDLAELERGGNASSSVTLGRGGSAPLGRISALSWSEDGQRVRGLLATGQGEGELFELDLATAAPRTLAKGAIRSVAWLPGDRVAYGTAEGRLVLLAIRGEPRALVTRPAPAVIMDGPVRLAPDGSQVLIRYAREEDGDRASPAPPDQVFSFSALALGAPEAPALPEAPASSGKRPVTTKDDPPLLVSVASADGRWMVARHADGTLRWYRAEDGALVVTLFPMADGRRWVAWTPHGYYATSTGGERLAGFEVAREATPSADFFSLGRMSDTFYRPDVVKAAFEDGGEDRALQRLGETPPALAALLPPVVDLIEPETPPRDGTLELRARVRSDSPISRWRVMVDGRPLASDRVKVRRGRAGDGAEGLARELSLDLPAGAKDISIFASSKAGTSEPATYRSLAHASAAQTPTPTGRPDLFVLAIGVSDYELNALDLRYARKDAENLADELRRQDRGGLYGRIQTRVVTDGQATRDGIERGLDWLSGVVGPEDQAVVFLSGHGETVGKKYYFGSYETNPDELDRSTLSGEVLREHLSEIPGRTLLLLDTCHASGVVSLTGMVNALIRPESGVVVLTSSRAEQLSEENEAWKNGAFTRALVDGLSGKADIWKDGKITIFNLASYVAHEVPKLTEGRQTPQIDTPGPIDDFELARNLALGPLACASEAVDLSVALQAASCVADEARTTWSKIGVHLALSPSTEAQRRWCLGTRSLDCTLVEPADEPPWAAGERVRVFRGELQHQGALRVEGDALVDGEALREIAAYLEHTPSVGLVVLGHAPTPAVAAQRARVAWEELVKLGVHPRRLSLRAEGPLGERPVSFQAVGRLDDEAMAVSVLHPWEEGVAGPPGETRRSESVDTGCDPGLQGRSPSDSLDLLACTLSQLPASSTTVRVRVPSGQPELERWCEATPGLSCAVTPEDAIVQADRIRLTDPIGFASGRAVLEPSARPVLEKLVKLLQAHPEVIHLVIEGHASQDGDFVANYELSMERARAILEAVVAAGISPERLSYRGLGEVLPAVQGETDFARERNRRVELYVIQEGV